MRNPSGLGALVLVALLAAACSGTAASASPSGAPSAASSIAPSVAPSATPDTCAPANLTLKTAGALTIGSDNPAYPPYFAASSPNPSPWELGDPTNGQGFEAAVAYAVADAMGFSKDKVAWQVTAFNNATGPGAKDFDLYIQEVSYSADRAQAVDLSDGYYDVAQSVVAVKGNKLATTTSIAALKDFQFGAQVGTTSLSVINTVINPSKAAKIYDTNNAAIEALKNGQIDGLVVDLPTAFYVTGYPQVENSVIVGQFTLATGEHFSLVLDKGSSITPCVNAAIAKIKADGSLAKLTQEWLADKASAPLFQP